jgi:hypothetical protein
MNATSDPKEYSALARSLTDLMDRERILMGVPNPGSLRPIESRPSAGLMEQQDQDDKAALAS